MKFSQPIKKEKSEILLGPKKHLYQKKTNGFYLNVEKIIISDTGIEKSIKESLIWHGFINQDEYARLIIPPKALSLSELIRYLSNTDLVSVGQNLFRSELWKKLSLPITLIGMSLIALPITGGALNVRQQSQRNLLAGVCAMFFYILHQTVSNFDKILGWPSSLSWTLPPVLIIFFSLVLIKKIRF